MFKKDDFSLENQIAYLEALVECDEAENHSAPGKQYAYAMRRATLETLIATRNQCISNKSHVQRICTAYESGFGRGLSGRDLAQPYANGSDEAEAYFIGYSIALDRHDKSMSEMVKII